jgi:hypothetical protein
LAAGAPPPAASAHESASAKKGGVDFMTASV